MDLQQYQQEWPTVNQQEVQAYIDGYKDAQYIADLQSFDYDIRDSREINLLFATLRLSEIREHIDSGKAFIDFKADCDFDMLSTAMTAFDRGMGIDNDGDLVYIDLDKANAI
jgi:hypothetical protein